MPRGCNWGAPYFNSRPSARGDVAELLGRHYIGIISIPAPPRGATRCPERPCASVPISIPAPPRGATTAAEWADKISAISIPAPPRGATATLTNFAPTIFISIPTPPRGATRPSAPIGPSCYFNSRPSARGDGGIRTPADAELFQFPPLREGRPDRLPPSGTVAISIPAPPRGATVTGCVRLKPSTFQFPPLREGRPLSPPQSQNIATFQFPPLREGRRRARPPAYTD